MNRQVVIDKTLKKINKLPDNKLLEVHNFVDFLMSKIDEKLLLEGIRQITSESQSFEYLKEEEDIYSVQDLKERYK